MKNKFIKLLSLALSIVMLAGVALTLGSCGIFEKTPSPDDILELNEDERAYKLFEIASRNSDKANSFSSETDLILELQLNEDFIIKASGEASTRADGIRASVLREHTENEIVVAVIQGDETAETSVRTVSGYSDGFYYREIETDGNTPIRLCSELSRLEYLDHLEFLSDGLDLSLAEHDSFTTTCTYNEDGSWTATYTDFFEEAMATFDSYISELSYLFPEGTELDDLVIELKVTEDFYIDSFTVEYIYKNLSIPSAVLPTVELTVQMFDYDTTELEAKDLSLYTVVDDIRAIDKTEKALSNMMDRSYSEFALEVDQYTYLLDGESEMDSIYSGSYSNTNGKFSYSLTVTDALDSDAEAIEITYSNGKQTVTGGEGFVPSVNSSSDEEQKRVLKQLFDYATFNPSGVRNVTKKGTGTYVFDLDIADISEFDVILESVGADSWQLSRSTLTVTLVGNKITAYAYELELNTAEDATGYCIEISTKLVFTK